MRGPAVALAAALLVGVAPAAVAAPVGPSAVAVTLTLTVTSTGDEDDAVADGVCATSVGTCTLRAALTEAQRQQTAPVVVRFALSGAGPFVLAPQTPLPALTTMAGVTIDGYSQPGSVVNTSPTASNAVIKVALTGPGPTGFDGLVVRSAHNTIRGLAVYGFRTNVRLTTSAAFGGYLAGNEVADNVLAGNVIGTDPSGSRAAGSTQAGADGVAVEGVADRTVIGGLAPADRNVISGNAGDGIALYAQAEDTRIEGNIIGLDPAGTGRLSNRLNGITVKYGTSSTMVGISWQSDGGNVISGNDREGVEITGSASLHGNRIGTDPAGTAAPRYAQNRARGVRVEGALYCATCQPSPADVRMDGNVVAGSGMGGLLVSKGAGARVTENRFGVLADGTPAGNDLWGIRIANGARADVQGNVVAHNQLGIQVDGRGVTPYDPVRLPTSAKINNNSVYANRDGLGVDLAPLGAANRPGTSDPLVNDGQLAPTVTEVTAGAVRGTTCADCLVEVYEADRPAGAVGSGRRPVAVQRTDASGGFAVPLDSSVHGKVVTASVTNGIGRGSTSEFSRNVAVPTPRPGNLPPVAVATGSCGLRLCTLSGAGSSDPDGRIVAWLWDFADYATAQGETVSHYYRRDGGYTASLTVVDDDGAQATTSVRVDPALPASVSAAADSFTRTVAAGWRYAERGGDYAYGAGADGLSVDGTTGLMRLPGPGSTRSASLPSVQARDIDMSVSVGPDSPDGTSAALLTRQVAPDTAYRSRLRFSPDGRLYVQAAKAVGGVETPISPEVAVAGQYRAGARYQLRAAVTGVNPTVLQVRAWQVGTAEPQSWPLEVFDGEPVLQTTASVGVLAAVSPSAAAAPVAFRFDTLRIGFYPVAPRAGG